MKKYELIKSDIEGLYRIKALKSFGDVREGEIGGYVESEKNLSQEKNCWVYENAKVFGSARVCENAKVCGNARVYGNAKVFGGAIVCKNAVVCGGARVYENAEILENTRVCENARVYGDASVFGDADVYGNARIYGDAEVCGRAFVKNAKMSKGIHIGKVCEEFDKILYIQCEYRMITIYKKNGVQYCNIGCQTGMTLEKLKERIEKDGGMTPHRQQYVDLMEQIKL